MLFCLATTTVVVVVVQAQEECSFAGSGSSIALAGMPNELTLRQYINSNDNTVTMELVYDDNSVGWIGIGYSETGQMVASAGSSNTNQAVIGLLPGGDGSGGEGTVALYNLQDRSTAGVTPVTSGWSSILTNASIEQTDTQTILRFTLPVTTAQDQQDVVFAAGQASTLIYAVGDSSYTLGYHAARASASVVFTECVIVAEEEEEAETPMMDDTAAAAAAAVCDISTTEATVLGNDVTLRQYINTDDDTVTLEVTYAGIGWIGIAYSPDGLMVQNRAVIGLPDDGTVAVYDLIGRSPDQVTLATENTVFAVTDASIEQTDEETILRFTRPVTEDGEVVFAAGQSTPLIYAVGSSNALGLHLTRAAANVVFDECNGAGAEEAPAPAENVAPPSPPPPTASPTASPTQAALDAAPGGPLQLSDDVAVTLSADEAAGTVDVELVYEGLGWVAFGLTPDGLMIGSEAVIGLPDEPVSPTNPAKYRLSARSNAGIEILPDAQQTLTNANIVQNDTHTVLTYTKLLEEDGELPISAIEANNFVFATGPSNTLGFHNQRSAVALAIGSDVVQGIELDTRKLWVAHGVMMAVSWGILVPIAIGSSMLRDILPLPPGMWFKIHFYTNSLAVLCTIIGFALAVKAINDETGGGSAAQHFEDPKHRTLGLAVFIMAVVQVGIALFRPHPPAAPTEKEEQDEESDEPVDKGHHSSEKSALRFAWECKHRLFAAALLGMAWYNVDTGLELFAGKFEDSDDLGGVFWGVLGGLVGCIVVAYIFSKVSKVMKKKDCSGSPTPADAGH